MDTIINPIINEKIKYDLNYIKENLDLKKFIKVLKKDLFWYGGSELSVIDYAQRCCLNNKNKDQNIINYKKNYNNASDAVEDFLILNLYNCETEHCWSKDPLLSETIKIPKKFLKISKNFYKEVDILVNSGDLLERISSKFKKIMHLEFVGEQGKNIIDSHSLYQLKINSSIEYFYLTKNGDYNQVVKFCDKLNEKDFVKEIVKFKSDRGYTGKKNFIKK
jgi:hypothetical protein